MQLFDVLFLPSMSSPRDSHHSLARRSVRETGLADGNGMDGVAEDPLARRLASAEQTLRDISHAMAHDVRTSLRHVASYAQLLGDPAFANDPAEVARLSHKVVESTRRLQHLMDSVSALSRLQTADLRHDRLDTGVLVHALIAERQSADGKRPVECVVSPDLPPMVGDGLLLRRVWEALLENAWQHAQRHERPRVEIRNEPAPDGCAFVVTDNGPVFLASQSREQFRLFRRTNAAPLAEPDSGLAMVRRIVECHGGRVWATSLPGEGTSLGFSLPVVGR